MGDAKDIDGNEDINKYFHSIIMLFPATKLSSILEIQMFNKMFADIIKLLNIQPIVLLTKSNIEHKDFTINDIFESKKINMLIQQL